MYLLICSNQVCPCVALCVVSRHGGYVMRAAGLAQRLQSIGDPGHGLLWKVSDDCGGRGHGALPDRTVSGRSDHLSRSASCLHSV